MPAPTLMHSSLTIVRAQAVLDTAARMMDIEPIEGYQGHLGCPADGCGTLRPHVHAQHLAGYPGDAGRGAATSSAPPERPSQGATQRAAHSETSFATQELDPLEEHECAWVRAEKRRVAGALCERSNNPAGWLHPVLSAIVSASSKRQALAGLIATGPLRSIAYVGQKVRKRFRDLFP